MTDETGSTMQQWHTFMRPILEVLSDGSVHPKRELEAAVVALVGLTDEQQSEQLDSGSLRSLNRIGWATSALRRAKALPLPPGERSSSRMLVAHCWPSIAGPSPWLTSSRFPHSPNTSRRAKPRQHRCPRRLPLFWTIRLRKI